MPRSETLEGPQTSSRRPSLVTPQRKALIRRAGLLSLCALSACGGAGVDVPLILPIGSLSASATSCTVQQGQTSCEVLLFAISANAVTISLRDSQGNGFSVQVNQNNVVTVRVPVGGATFTFNYGGTNDAVINIQASCAPGLVFNGQRCEARP